MRSVYRTARVVLRVTSGQRRRCFGLLRASGDAWAGLIDMNRHRFRRGGRPIASYRELCREVAGVQVGELSAPALRSVVRRYSDAFFETARRKRKGERARYPHRKHALFPVRWYRGTFRITPEGIRLSVAKGRPDLWVRLSRPVPYPIERVRSVTLLCEDGRLVLDVTAGVAVSDRRPDSTRIAGVDVGLIHPFAATIDNEGLVVSGRAIRAEERVHLADTKARASYMSRKQPRRGQVGSRRWRKARARQRRLEVRHRRRVRLAQHRAAKILIDWALARDIGTLAIGDLAGIANRAAGRRQNLRLRQWRRTHLVGAVRDKAETAGIAVLLVNERGTSSTCPECSSAARPTGRRFTCPACGYEEHRDLVGARNITARSGGNTRSTLRVTHRRAGTVPARRDRRRHLWDRRRSSPAPGRPAESGSRSLAGVLPGPVPGTTTVVDHHRPPARIEQRRAEQADVA